MGLIANYNIDRTLSGLRLVKNQLSEYKTLEKRVFLFLFCFVFFFWGGGGSPHYHKANEEA